jgi:RNA polymerase sigma factor (sigma-70 family)
MPALRRYARVLTGDAWAADDLVQDTLERACRKWLLWRSGSNLRAWLFTLMHNLFANQARSLSRRAGSGAKFDPDDVAGELRAPDSASDLTLDLQRCLLRLPAEQRAVLLLVSMEDLSYEEVASVLAIPVGTVMSRLSRARSRLRELLDAPAGDLAARPAASGAPTVAPPEMTEPDTVMDPHDTRPGIPDDDLHAWLDGRLPEDQRHAVDDRLAHDPAARDTVAAYRSQREALRALHRTLLDEPVPPALQAAAQRLADSRQRTSQWWRWGGMAAGFALVFVTGWLSHGQWQAVRGGETIAARARGTGQEFVRQAAVAHAVYAPEVRHPVEVAAAQQEHLIQWLSKRLGRPLKVPDLSGQGYELVGGRLLPGDTGARAQFMYQTPGGERVTLYLGALDGGADATARQETAFSFSGTGPVPGFYWVDQGFGYALAGKLSREALLQLAQAVYQQL